MKCMCKFRQNLRPYFVKNVLNFFLQHITSIVPDFYEHLDMLDDSSMPLPPLDDDSLDESDDDFQMPTSRPASRVPDQALPTADKKGISPKDERDGVATQSTDMNDSFNFRCVLCIVILMSQSVIPSYKAVPHEPHETIWGK